MVQSAAYFAAIRPQEGVAARRELEVSEHQEAELCQVSARLAVHPPAFASAVEGPPAYQPVRRAPSARLGNPAVCPQRACLSCHNAPDRKAARK